VADERHLEILARGVTAWNEWRTHHQVEPDLAQADLSGRDLRGVILNYADLNEADLNHTNLTRAQFNHANLAMTNLEHADLLYAAFAGANLRSANLMQTNFSYADLFGAQLTGANLRDAKLYKANLGTADLSNADLRSTDFREAYLTYTRFSGAYLGRADLTRADASGADFSHCIMAATNLSSTNLSKSTGLETVEHAGPSIIGIETLYRSAENLPESFLRGAGIPESFVVNMKSLLAAMSPIEFYSCFISYSSKDQELAERLHADLRSKNVRCWFAPEELKIGDRLRPSFDEAIRMHDKLMVLLSESSVRSAWVEKEVETAFEKERREKRTVLFPIRLDDAVMETNEAWAADIRRTRHIGDFRDWKNHDAYKKAFERLLRDLKA
jgi:uncharacterized protein YjbI with pentapeptide repeats